MANEPWKETEEELRKKGYDTKVDDNTYEDKYGNKATGDGKFYQEEKYTKWHDSTKDED